MDSTVLFEVRDHVAVITLNRPEKKNAINRAMRKEVQDAKIKLDSLKVKRDEAERMGDTQTAADIEYYAIPETKALIERLEADRAREVAERINLSHADTGITAFIVRVEHHQGRIQAGSQHSQISKRSRDVRRN